MNVLLDVDDVLLEWRVGFENWLIKTRPITYKKIIDEYETVERALTQGNKTLMKTATEFNEELEFSQLSPLSDAVDYVRKLYENGFKLYCITS
jgi:FMN phosphatase YigB (HAD superfamily)